MGPTTGTLPKTPPESDPSKENQKMPAGEISPGSEDFEDIRPRDDGTLQTIDTEAPGLTGN